MKIIMEIDLENDVFHPDFTDEVRRILRETAEGRLPTHLMENEDVAKISLSDINGSKCGFIGLARGEPKVENEKLKKVKSKIASDVTKVIGKGSRTDNNPCDWVLVETPRGEVALKQFMTGPGLSCDTQISANWYLTMDDAFAYGEDMGYFFEVDAPEIDEPVGHRFVVDY